MSDTPKRNELLARRLLALLLLASVPAHAADNTDKLYHATAGAVASATASMIADKLDIDRKYVPWIGFGVGLLAGVAKEVYDHNHGGAADGWDIAATGVGSLVSFTVSWK